MNLIEILTAVKLLTDNEFDILLKQLEKEKEKRIEKY
jgi:hypothetical protein